VELQIASVVYKIYGRQYDSKTVQIQNLSLYKQTNVYTNVIEISVILIKRSLHD